jgi:RNA polymerase sigma-B factor
VLGAEDPSLELLESDGGRACSPAAPPRERKVLYLRFFRGMTQSEIAREVGVSQMHVSRLLAQSLRFLRETVEDEGWPLAGPESG